MLLREMEDAFMPPKFKLKYHFCTKHINKTSQTLVAVYSFTNYSLKYISITAHLLII